MSVYFNRLSNSCFSNEDVETVEAPSICRGYVRSLVSVVQQVYSYIFFPNEHPTWTGALTKTGIGIVGLISIDQTIASMNYHSALEAHKQMYERMNHGEIDSPNTNIPMRDPRYNYPSVALIVNGIREIFSVVCAQITPARQVKSSNLSKAKQSSEERRQGWDRLMKIGALMMYSGMSLRWLYCPDVATATTKFTSHFLATVMHVTDICINYRELKNFNKESFLSSNPLIEFIHTYVLWIFLSKLGSVSPEARAYSLCVLEKKSFSQCEHLLPPGIDAERYMHSVIKESGIHLSVFNRYVMPISYVDLSISYAKEYAKFYSLLRVSMNALRLLVDNIASYRSEEPALIKQEERVSTHSKAIYRNRPANEEDAHSNDRNAIVGNSNHSRAFSSGIAAGGAPVFIERRLEKKKTRGIAHEQNAIETKKVSPSQSSQYSDLPEKVLVREAALQRIQALEKSYPVKVHEITSELKKAAMFLNGAISGVDGSEFSLSWTIGNSRFALKYEMPHERDATNFAGNKLARVLNVLKVCYLVGLSEVEAASYIEKYNFQKLYRLQKWISYIFLQRRNAE